MDHSPSPSGRSTSSASNGSIKKLSWEELWSIFATRTSPDFTFLVRQYGISTLVESCKSFLIARSTELAKLVKNSIDDTFTVEDMNPDVFIMYHEFLHTGKFDTRSDIRDSDVIKLLLFSAQYCPGREEAEETCRRLMDGRLSLKNVFKLNQHAKTWNLSSLGTLTERFIAKVNLDPEYFIATNSFQSVSASALREMLKSDDLNCDEVKLFEAVMNWGQNKPPSSARTDLDQVKYELRFPLMSASDFAEKVVPSGILSTEDALEILVYICTSPDKKPVMEKFNTNPRRRKELGVVETIDISEPDDVDMEVVKEESAPSSPSQNLLYPVIKMVSSGSIVMSDNNDEKNYTYAGNYGNEGYADASYEMPNSYTPELEDGNYGNEDFFQTVDPPHHGNDLLGNHDNAKPKSKVPTKLKVSSWDKLLSQLAHSPTSPTHIIAIVKPCDPVTFLPPNPLLLPHLVKVSLSLTIRPDRRKWHNNVRHYRTNFDLDPYIFWTTDFFATRTDFELVINGVKFFKLDKPSRELCIGFEPAETSTNDILSRMLTPDETKLDPRHNFLKVLILVANTLPDVPFPYHKLREVTLWGVYDVGDQLGRFLKKLRNLEVLECRTKGEKIKTYNDRAAEMEVTRMKSMINLGTDFTSGDKLTKVAICWAKLIVKPGRALKCLYSGVTKIYTDYCFWSREILDNFDKIFPNVERVAFGYCPPENEGNEENEGNKKAKVDEGRKTLVSGVSVRLMRTLVRKCKKIGWIRVVKLDWELEPLLEKEVKEVKVFLEKAGIEVKDDGMDFLVQRDGKDGEWKGVKYIGRGYKERHAQYQKYWKEMDHLEYENFGLNKIFKDFDTFREYNVEH